MYGLQKLTACCLVTTALFLSSNTGHAQEAPLPPDVLLSAEGFTTASDVRPHNRLPLDVAEMRAALAMVPPDYGTALLRYGFGKHFTWRDAAHSLGYFADDYQGRLARTLPGAAAIEADTGFQHRFMTAALFGTGLFEGGGQKRSAPDALRIAAIEAGALSLILNWCRLELSEASIRGPKNNNWSLANGSPKNWSELFAFWYGPNGAHSLHAALTPVVERLKLADHPTRMLAAALAKGQPALLQKTWPQADAETIRAIMDQVSLILLVDRLARLDADIAAGGDASATALGGLRGTWIGAVDAVGRADVERGKKLHAAIMRDKTPPKAADLKAELLSILPALGLTSAQVGL